MQERIICSIEAEVPMQRGKNIKADSGLTGERFI